METLFSIYPNVQDLLTTPPEDLAPVFLTLAKGMVQNGMFQPEAVNDIAIAAPHALHGPARLRVSQQTANRTPSLSGLELD